MSRAELATRLTALSRLLVSEGHLTPAGARQIAKVLADATTGEAWVPEQTEHGTIHRCRHCKGVNDWTGHRTDCPVYRAAVARSQAARGIAPVSSGEADDLASLTAKFEALKPKVEAEIERRKNTPTCPTCGSDGDPYEAKDGSPCPNPFHAAPVSSGEAGTGEAVQR